MYDRFEQIVFDAQASAAILGNITAREFVLVDLAPGPIPEDLYGRGLSFCGVTGIVNGVPRTAFAVELDDAALSVIAQAWIQHLAGMIAAKLPPRSLDDSAQFLERLYALEDPRR